MARTRSARNQNPETSIRKRFKTVDDSAAVPWSNLHHDMLFLILMKLGLIDFLAFSGVCRTWRSFALSNRNVFMASRRPMSVTIRPHAKRACYFVDFEGRRSKTLLPSFTGRFCVGLTCGYLIMFGRKTRDFWLVNPITRHELNFPVLPSSIKFPPTNIRAILVFSPLLSCYVLVITHRSSTTILYCLSREAASWRLYFSSVLIDDLHAFKGKIYVLNSNFTLCELKLNPHPKLVPLKIKNGPEGRLLRPELLSSSEELFLFGFSLSRMAFELDIDKMEWVSGGKSSPMGEHVIYSSPLKCSAVIESKKTADPSKYTHVETFFLGGNKILREEVYNSRIVVVYIFEAIAPTVWYFPHDCYNVNLLQE